MKNYVVVENHNDGTLSVMLIEKYREMSKGLSAMQTQQMKH